MYVLVIENRYIIYNLNIKVHSPRFEPTNLVFQVKRITHSTMDSVTHTCLSEVYRIITELITWNINSI